MRKNKLPKNHNFQFGKALPVSRIIFTDFFLFVIVKMERHLREAEAEVFSVWTCTGCIHVPGEYMEDAGTDLVDPRDGCDRV